MTQWTFHREVTLAVQMVIARDGHRCVRCRGPLAGTIGHGWDVIRRLESVSPRAVHEPALDHPANLISVCGSGHVGCAARIRRADARYESIGLGYIVEPGQAPALHRILIAGEWVWLTDDGGTTSVEPVAVVEVAA